MDKLRSGLKKMGNKLNPKKKEESAKSENAEIEPSSDVQVKNTESMKAEASNESTKVPSEPVIEKIEVDGKGLPGPDPTLFTDKK